MKTTMREKSRKTLTAAVRVAFGISPTGVMSLPSIAPP
jgi:hypothetical protein